VLPVRRHAAHACLLLVIAAAPAVADDYCAGASGCDGAHSYAADAAGLQSALSAAQARAGEDTVRVGAGLFSAPAGFTYSSPDVVNVVGAGTGQTMLESSCGSAVLTMSGNVSSVLTGVSLHGGNGACQPAFSGSGTLRDMDVSGGWTSNSAITLAGGALERVAVNAPTTGSATGVSTGGATVLLDVRDSTISGAVGIVLDTNGIEGRVSRTRVVASDTGVLATRGTNHVEDTLIRTTATSSRGVIATAEGAADTTLNASHLTIVGEAAAPGGDTGLRASATNGRTATLNLDHAIIRGYATSLNASATGGAHGYINVGASDFDNSTVVRSGGGDRDIVPTADNRNSNADPGFVNAAAGDDRLLVTSPDIDNSALFPALRPMESSTDLAGMPRIVDGTSPFEGAKRDFGAFEYQGRPPTAAASAAPASVFAGDTVTFSGTGTDPDPGESTLSYAWTFDEGLPAKGATVQRVFGGVGTHTGTVTVTDPSGRTATAVATVTVAARSGGASGPGGGSGPAGPGGGPGGNAADTTAAVFQDAKLSRRVLRGAQRSAFLYTLSEAATVRVTIQQRRGGRRVGRRCVAPSRKNRRRKRCTRFKTATAVSHAAAAGANRVPFTEHLGGRDLPLGAYRAVLRATDAAGNRSIRVRLAFRIAST
jgi:hypothetical protein